jgi:hypothetical protein
MTILLGGREGGNVVRHAIFRRFLVVVELRGLEPLTSSMAIAGSASFSHCLLRKRADACLDAAQRRRRELELFLKSREDAGFFSRIEFATN